MLPKSPSTLIIEFTDEFMERLNAACIDLVIYGRATLPTPTERDIKSIKPKMTFLEWARTKGK